MTQFVSVVFFAGARRAYTYHNDGAPVLVGDEVKVADREGNGWQRVTVVGLSDEAPPFPTKPILGLAPEAAD